MSDRRPGVHFLVESGTDARLVEGLDERFRLTVVARRITGGREISQTPARRIPVIVGPASRLLFALFVLRHMFLTQSRGRPDLVLVQGYALAALAANLASAILRIPCWMLVCSPAERYYLCRRGRNYPGKAFRWSEFLGLKLLAHLNARLGKGYVVLSAYLARVVRQHGARGKIEIARVYGVDTEVFRPSEEPRWEFRSRLGLPIEGPLIFFSSRIAPEKDAETLLEAIRLLHQQGRAVRVLNLSGGSSDFLAAARARGVAPSVIAGDAVHPHRDLPDYYRASDLCVQASRDEGLGFSPLEAMACGIPVVATAAGGLAETVVDGTTGWTYPPGDHRALAERISHVLSNLEEARRAALNGRRLVCDQFERRIAFDTLEGIVRREVAREAK